MRNFFVQIGNATTQQGVIDMMKQVTADGYEIDSQGMLRFYVWDKPLPDPDARKDDNYAVFRGWNFVYVEDALPAEQKEALKAQREAEARAKDRKRQ